MYHKTKKAQLQISLQNLSEKPITLPCQFVDHKYKPRKIKFRVNRIGRGRLKNESAKRHF